jgi:hypothetical protein
MKGMTKSAPTSVKPMLSGGSAASRRRDERHYSRHIVEQQRLARDVERAHVLSKTGRKGAFQIVGRFDRLVHDFKAEMVGHSSERIQLCDR